MNVVFLGTPTFAVYSLNQIAKSHHNVLACITQPDKIVGRKAVLTPSPVKVAAENLGIKVLQYDSISKSGINDLKLLNPDIVVTCAFGQILSKEVLEIPKFGVINVHASLLPKYRGASPIQAAVLNGDAQTGITIMQTEVSLDSGDIIMVEKVDILPDETTDELFLRLAPIGASLVVDALDAIENGSATYTKQDESKVSFVKQIKKADALIDFSKSATSLHNFVRGMQTWPCAYTVFDGKIFKIHKAVVEKNIDFINEKIGSVVIADPKNGLKVVCGDGILNLLFVQLEGGKMMSSKDFILGRKIKIGDILGK